MYHHYLPVSKINLLVFRFLNLEYNSCYLQIHLALGNMYLKFRYAVHPKTYHYVCSIIIWQIIIITYVLGM